MTKGILLLTSLLTCSCLNDLFAQKAIAYFIPSYEFNVSEYKDQTEAGVKMNISRLVYYKLQGENVELTDVLLSSNEVVNKSISIQKITSNAVYKLSTNVGNGMKYFSEPICVLKVPPKNGSLNWITDVGSKKQINTSSWTTVEYFKEKRSAIKIVKRIVGLPAFSIDYYVENIGFWKSEIVSKNKVTVMDKLQRLFFKNLALDDQISQYEEKLLSNSFKSKDGVSIKENDYRIISWSTTLNNASNYTREKIEKMGFEYLKIEDNDPNHITYAYRNCSKNLLLKITEWYDFKISLSLEWFSNDVKKSITSFYWCIK